VIEAGFVADRAGTKGEASFCRRGWPERPAAKPMAKPASPPAIANTTIKDFFMPRPNAHFIMRHRESAGKFVMRTVAER
jgi:hypothetical protein